MTPQGEPGCVGGIGMTWHGPVAVPLVPPVPVVPPVPPPHGAHASIPSAPHMQSMHIPVGDEAPQRKPTAHAAPGVHMPPVIPPVPPVPPASGLSPPHGTHVSVPFAPHMQSWQVPSDAAPPQREPGVQAAPAAHVPPPVIPPAPAPAPPAPVVPPASGLSAQGTHVRMPFAPHMQSWQTPFAEAPPQRKPGVQAAPTAHVPPPVVPPAPVPPVVAPVPLPASAAGTPPSAVPVGPVLPPRATGSVPAAKQQAASKPSAVSVHELTVAPTKFAHGLPSLQRGGGGQFAPPVVPAGPSAHARPAPVFTQIGAEGAKQHAPVKPLVVFVQF